MKTLPLPTDWIQPLDLYARFMRAGGRPDTSIKLRRYHVLRFATETGLSPWSVEAQHLIAFLGAQRKWKPSTRRSMAVSLKNFYRWAHDMGHMDINIGSAIPTIPCHMDLPRPAPDAVIREAMASAGERERLMIRLGAELGLRCCEIARLHLRDISGEYDSYTLLVHGKGGKVRNLPASSGLVMHMRGYAEETGSGWIFPGKIGGHLSSKRVSELLAEALPGEWTGHNLRHRFATTMYGASGDLRSIQELMGHASVVTTQVYTKVDNATLRNVAVSAALMP